MKKDSIKVGIYDLTFENGKYARQADGAIITKYGDIVMISSAQSGEAMEGQDFFPMTVEYTEKAYAFGKIPGGFTKRESRSSKQTLISRLTDRPLRPLFPKGYFNEVQVLITCLSADKRVNHDVMTINAASMALMVSSIPFEGPVGAVRVGKIGEDFIINPTYRQMNRSELNLVLAGTSEAIMMVESDATEISEKDMVEALEFGHNEIKKICEFQNKFAEGITKPKAIPKPHELPEDLVKEITELCQKPIESFLPLVSKQKYDSQVRELKETVRNKYKEKYLEDIKKSNLLPEIENSVLKTRMALIDKILFEMVEEIERKLTREGCLKGKRVDNRKLTEIRKLSSEFGILPQAAGSGVFTRGETQSLGICTFGNDRDELVSEEEFGYTKKKFFLHYNFPPFSTGEVRPQRAPGRREIGHGMLAERALKAVIPSKGFGKTIRIVSEILESNGSSSMATVCSATLSLLNAKVPIKAPVAGIAMGLVKEGDESVVLTDIQFLEDHHGDMDFKVCGTRKGVTALQMDIKIKGITKEIMAKALEQAKVARLEILDSIENDLKKFNASNANNSNKKKKSVLGGLFKILFRK